MRQFNSTTKRVGTKVYQSTYMGMVIRAGVQYPLNEGNFFTLRMSENTEAWVQNISAEDFEEICDRLKLTTVTVIHLPDEECCFIADSRIPTTWLRRLPEQLR